ncbi:MAG TPA: RcpC/CpaB family pilus assembly protein [Egibacteraceae bacterium]|nr:RcpC/CpaB family pilus assembly protein [Egibacteraceae bacterium]
MITAALVALVANYGVLRSQDDTARVAVAAIELRPGAVLTSASFAFTDIDADDALLATLLEPDRAAAMVGSIASASLRPGDLIRAGDLVEPAAPSQRRAMSIPVEPARAVGGQLRSGDRVDVIEVRDGAASYVVTDAEVLAVADPGGARGLSGLGAFSITVAVDDAAALRLAAAIQADRVQIVRSTGSAPATLAPAPAAPRGLPAGEEDANRQSD